MAAQNLALDNFWVDRSTYSAAEQCYYERLGHETLTPLVAEFVKARETIKEMKRQANEVADTIGDGFPVKENRNDNPGKLSKKQKQKAAKEAKNAKNNTEKNVDLSNQNQLAQVPHFTEIDVITTCESKESTASFLQTSPQVVPTQTTTDKNENQKQKVQEQEIASISSEKVEVKSTESNGGCNVAMDCEPVKFLEKKMLAFTDMMAKVQSQLEAMDARLSSIEDRVGRGAPTVAVCPVKPPATYAIPAAKPAVDDDDDVDLFGSESEDDETAAKVKEERLAAYNAKKSKKPALIAKSSIILDVKPWDDETDMKKMEEVVRKIECDGLLWGASKLVPLAYGIKKLQINCVVEDEKVSIDWLQEQIESNEDYVQSVDIAAFNKI